MISTKRLILLNRFQKSSTITSPHKSVLKILISFFSNFSKTSFGYKLTVQVKGNDNYRQLQDDRLFAQLYFVPKGEVSKAYINGTFVTRTDDGGAVFTFDFYTRYDLEHVVVSKENYIFLSRLCKSKRTF